MHLDIHKILSMPVAVDKTYGKVLLPLAISAMKGVAQSKEFLESMENRKQANSSPMLGVKANNKTVKVKAGDAISFNRWMQESDVPAGSIALIRINDFISYSGGWCSKGLVDYEKEMIAAAQNKNIKGVILKVNSCGGSVEGLDNFANFVGNYQKKYGKPLAALIDPQAKSAAYYLLCKAPRIFANGVACEAGSIGTMVTIYDYSAMMEMEGIKEIETYATNSVEKNAPYNDLLKGDKTKMQQYLDKYNNMFINAVSAGRSNINKTIRIPVTNLDGNVNQVPEVFTGKVYVGEEMIEMGLIDEISDLQGVVSYIERTADNMGIGTDSTTLVETETPEEEFMEEMYYDKTETNNIMYKNLDNQTLQSQFDSAKVSLNQATTEKGYNSPEVKKLANDVEFMRMELDSRKATAQIEATAKQLEASQKEVDALKVQLQSAQNTSVDSAKLKELESKNAELLAASNEMKTKNSELQSAVEVAAKEKTEAQSKFDALQTEKTALENKIQAHETYMKKNGIEVPEVVVAQSVEPEGGNQPEGLKEPKEELSATDKVRLALKHEQDRKKAAK